MPACLTCQRLSCTIPRSNSCPLYSSPPSSIIPLLKPQLSPLSFALVSTRAKAGAASYHLCPQQHRQLGSCTGLLLCCLVTAMVAVSSQQCLIFAQIKTRRTSLPSERYDVISLRKKMRAHAVVDVKRATFSLRDSQKELEQECTSISHAESAHKLGTNTKPNIPVCVCVQTDGGY